MLELTAETVERTTLPLEGVYDVHRGHGFPFCVLCVRDSIANDVFQEHFKHTSSFFIDQTGDSLHSTTTSKTPDGRLGNSLKNKKDTYCLNRTPNDCFFFFIIATRIKRSYSQAPKCSCIKNILKNVPYWGPLSSDYTQHFVALRILFNKIVLAELGNSNCQF